MNKNQIFELTLSELSQSIGQIDFICLTETFMKKGSESNLRLPGYKLSSFFSRQEQRRGGSCILVNRDLDYIPLKIVEELACLYCFECSGIELTYFNLIVICIYRTPKSNVHVFLDKLTTLLQTLTRQNKNIIVCGDWNIDILKENTLSLELKTILRNYNFNPHIYKPTRGSSSIDQIATNMGQTNLKVNVHSLGLSDHDTGQSISFSVLKKGSNATGTLKSWTEFRREINNDNIKKFMQCISSLTFCEVYEENDCNKCFELFHDLFKLFYDLCFPVIEIKARTKTSKSKWISKGLKKSCNKKRSLYLKYQREAKNKSYNLKIYLNYTRLLKKCIHKSQKIINTKYIERSKNMCKASWNVIKSNVTATNDKREIREIIKDNIKYNRPSELSELFNDHFINLTSNNSSKNKNIDSNKDVLIADMTNSMFIEPMTEPEVTRIINLLNNTNSTGYDRINTKIIKLSSKFIASPLSHIINKSFEQGIFPDRLKLSIVKPLYKTGDPTRMENYRPITLITIFSKIFEKAMVERINNFISKGSILVSNQFAFRKGSSTTQACFTLVKEVTEAINDKLTVMGIFLDMSKAFDWVCHSRLLLKVQRYGLRGKVYEWLLSYLSERYQVTEISKIVNGKMITVSSSSKVIQTGVPQGSILGPLLFLLYINDLPNALKHDCILFADDTTLLIKCKEKSDLEVAANEEIKVIARWMENNNLKLNVDKTNVLHFRPYNSKEVQIKLELDNLSLLQSSNAKFLGIIVDANLSWKNHIDAICVKIDKFVFALRRLRLETSQNTALTAYHGYVSSVLRYGLIVWGDSVDSQRAFKLQKKCIRAICGADYLAPCRPLFEILKILPLPCQYILDICVFVKKYPHLFILSDQVTGKTNSRDPQKLWIPKQRLTLFTNNVYCKAIKIYNRLPNDIRRLDINKFRSIMTKWLQKKCFYSCKEYLDMNYTLFNDLDRLIGDG